MTIEEFDADIKLNYERDLQSIASNAKVGEEYFKEHQFAFELFENYFKTLTKMCKRYPDEIKNAIFRVFYFHFEQFTNLKTIEDINFFLDICDYSYGISEGYFKDLFDLYRKYINSVYEELEDTSDFTLD